MNKIEVKVLNPTVILESERMMVAMARMTQRGHKISCMADFEELLARPYTEQTVDNMTELPHPTIQKFGVINVAIIGASRRFLAQITRHQNEVKFMSGSLQYSDYTGAAQFVVPYEIMKYDQETATDSEAPRAKALYEKQCEFALEAYELLAQQVGRDAAGYAMPQGLRNVLVISATPYQWKHMISQRICKRNTLETQFVMLRCWEELVKVSSMFINCGPSCMVRNRCDEGKMSCKHFLHDKLVDDYMNTYTCSLPTAILRVNFPLIGG